MQNEDDELLFTIGELKIGGIIFSDDNSELEFIGSDCFGQNWYRPWKEVIYWSYIPEIQEKKAEK